jgi:hypothetical protein
MVIVVWNVWKNVWIFQAKRGFAAENPGNKVWIFGRRGGKRKIIRRRRRMISICFALPHPYFFS